MRIRCRVPTIRIREAAGSCSSSDDTVRRWVDGWRNLAAAPTSPARKVLGSLPEGGGLRAQARRPGAAGHGRGSAIRRATGSPVWCKVVTDAVIGSGRDAVRPVHVVSLMSTDAVRRLQLEPGSVAVAVVRPPPSSSRPPGDRR